MLLESFAPPSVIANGKGEILYIHGQTGKYLEPAPGRPNWNVFDMARKGIQSELRLGVHYALTKMKERQYQRLSVKTNHDHQLVNLTIRPFVPAKEVRGLVTILFEDTWEQEKRKSDRKGRKKSQADRDERLQETERELAYTRETLQATVEELQASNEELKSTNEELQSTNEELETSREELQSMNEELTTVNSELQGKIEQLFHSEEDMRVLLENTNIETAAREFAESIVETIRDPLVVLDGDLQVVSANRSFYTTFQVSKEETEKRLIYELGNCQWDIPEFRKLLGEILPQDNKIEDYLVEHDFPGIGRKRMLLNARRIISDVIAQRPMILLAIEDVATHRESLSGKQPA